MSKLYNLARMTTATAGTDTITLGSAVVPYLTFALAGVQNGETVSYAIKDITNGGSEIGTGVYTSAGTTLTRSVTKSTNSDAAINLSGSAEVFITPRAEDILVPANNLSDVADAATVRTNLGLAIGTNVQAYDADLTTWAGITPGTGVGTFLTTPSSANLLAALTDETGSGAAVFATSPTLVTPILGTPTSGTLTNCTGLPVAGGGTGVTTVAGIQGLIDVSRVYISLTGVNANSAATDNAMAVTFPTGTTKFRIGAFSLSNPSVSLTTATAGVFTATGGGGVALFADQALATLTTNAANTVGNLMSLSGGSAAAFNSTTLYLRIGTAQGAAATFDATFELIFLA